MAKERTAHAYELELRKMIKSRTGADMELWLLPQVRATAANMVILDKIQSEILDSDSLIVPVLGSQGQMKNEVCLGTVFPQQRGIRIDIVRKDLSDRQATGPILAVSNGFQRLAEVFANETLCAGN